MKSRFETRRARLSGRMLSFNLCTGRSVCFPDHSLEWKRKCFKCLLNAFDWQERDCEGCLLAKSKGHRAFKSLGDLLYVVIIHQRESKHGYDSDEVAKDMIRGRRRLGWDKL